MLAGLIFFASGRRLLRGEAREQSVTLIMIVVVLVFIVCNVPAKGVQITLNYRYQSCPTVAFFVQELSVVFELISSSVNFLVYCVFLRHFRQRFSQPFVSSAGVFSAGGRSGARRSLCGHERDKFELRPPHNRRTTGDSSPIDGGPSGTPAVIYRRCLDF